MEPLEPSSPDPSREVGKNKKPKTTEATGKAPTAKSEAQKPSANDELNETTRPQVLIHKDNNFPWTSLMDSWGKKIDDRGHELHGVSLNEKQINENIDFNSSKAIIETIINDNPNFRLYYNSDFSKYDPSKPLAVIISDIHKPEPRKLSVDLVSSLYQNQKLNLSSGLFEDTKIAEPLLDLSSGAMIEKGAQVWNIVKSLSLQEGKQIDFYAGDSTSWRIFHDLISIAVLNHIRGIEDPLFGQYLRNLVNNIFTQQGQENDGLNFTNKLATLIAEEYGLTIDFLGMDCNKAGQEYHVEIPVFKFPAHLSQKEIDLFHNAAIRYAAIKRDSSFTSQFANFGSGIHPLIIGTIHIPNIVSELEKQGIPCLVIGYENFSNSTELLKEHFQTTGQDDLVEAYKDKVTTKLKGTRF